MFEIEIFTADHFNFTLNCYFLNQSDEAGHPHPANKSCPVAPVIISMPSSNYMAISTTENDILVHVSNIH